MSSTSVLRRVSGRIISWTRAKCAPADLNVKSILAAFFGFTPFLNLFAPFLTPSIRCTYGMYVSQSTHIAHYIRYAIKPTGRLVGRQAKSKSWGKESLEVGVHWIGYDSDSDSLADLCPLWSGATYATLYLFNICLERSLRAESTAPVGVH